MEGFNAISLKLKEMYQVWESDLSLSAALHWQSWNCASLSSIMY